MSERWCECPEHQSRDFRELTDFYSTHFIPTGWRLEYTTLLEREERRTLYITGECSQCGGFMRTGEDITGSSTHDSLLREVCASMLRHRPYAGQDAYGLYRGGVPQRLEWYWRQDQMTKAERIEQFAGLFHEGVDQLIARRWAKEHMPAQDVPRETTTEFFYGVVKLVQSTGFWPQQSAFIVCEPACPTWTPEVALCHPQFGFLPELKAERNSGLCIECYLDGVFDKADNRKLLIGTIRTACDDRDTHLIMGSLAGALLYYGEVYRESNMDRYVPYKAVKLPELRPQKENENGK